jgi:A/G-specific adenine glycosylase
MSFGKSIIAWYELNKRELPWRETGDPYKIWLSEIILQQTRVDQGMSYYFRFVEKYPDLRSFAAAKEDEVLKLWQGLGYYSRARNMMFAAKQIMNEHGRQFPNEYEKIKSLKGIGDYTAAAIASFAFGLKHPVVDGNVFRLLSRYLGIKTPIDTTKGKNEFTLHAKDFLGDYDPAIFNQAIMEFGSKQCKPSNPDCQSCPLNVSCYAFRNKSVQDYPVKQSKTKIRNRYFNYLIIRESNSIVIKKRSGKDIWQGLHDFPLVETKSRINESEFLSLDELKKFRKKNFKINKVSSEYKHILSHQHIHARFYEIESENIFNDVSSEWKKIKVGSIKKYAVPKLIENYLLAEGII